MPTGALDAALHPRAIAVVGAGSGRETIGGLLFGNLVDSRFEGTILPVNRQHPTVQGFSAYPDLGACPVRPDLAVVCVPAAAVLPVVAQAGELGIPAVCVISAGFAEIGPEGAARQEALLATAARGGVRLVGPNCTGILGGGTSAGSRFNATFSRTVPPPGRVALLSQSGAIGLAVLDQADAHRLGIGCFVSTGNSADIGTNELLDYWANDPETDLVLLYLEAIADAPGFVRAARRVGDRVPIVAVKAGRTVAGRRGAASHTAALAAGDAAVDGVLRQAGVIRAESVPELLDVARLVVAHGSRPRRPCPRVAIVTNGGGPGIVAADACERNRLDVPSLAPETSGQLRLLLPPEAGTANPVDLIASATASLYGDAVRIVAASGEVDTIMVIYNTPLITTAADVGRELLALRADLRADVRLVTVWMNREGPPPGLEQAGIPAFVYPEDAARALALQAQARTAPRMTPLPVADVPAVDACRVAGVVASGRYRADADGWLGPDDAAALLDAAGIARVRERLVTSPDGAAAAASALGTTVVVKVAGAMHKSDIGGVRGNVDGPAAAADAVREMSAGLAAHRMSAHGFVVQEQIESGLEMLVGVYRDPGLGPLVVTGLGGTLAELLDDVAVRLAPVTAADAADQVASLRGYRLLTGYRGSGPLDVDALVDVIQRVAVIAETAPDIAELDINPLFVRPSGAVAADVRVRIATPRAATPPRTAPPHLHQRQVGG